MENTLYGVWTGTGWMTNDHGEIICDERLRIMRARWRAILVNGGNPDWHVREIGEDGKPCGDALDV